MEKTKGLKSTGFDEIVINHFRRTGRLHMDVLRLTPDRIEELIDAIPTENNQLIEMLKELLRAEGVRI